MSAQLCMVCINFDNFDVAKAYLVEEMMPFDGNVFCALFTSINVC